MLRRLFKIRKQPPPSPTTVNPPDFAQVERGSNRGPLAFGATVLLGAGAAWMTMRPATVEPPLTTPIELDEARRSPPAKEAARPAPTALKELERKPPPTASQTPVRVHLSEPEYHRGPRGGCYTIGSTGRKNYVAKSKC